MRRAAVGATVLHIGLAPVIGLAACIVAASLAVFLLGPPPPNPIVERGSDLMPTVLVTGAACGIGNTIVAHLGSAGWDVIAGVRSQADADVLSALPRVSTVLLMSPTMSLIAALPTVLPGGWTLVNNAGVAVSGPIEALTAAQLRRQLDVNVVGQLAVTNAVLPKLRASRGRILFISQCEWPNLTALLGAYSASKFALEAAADALRLEPQAGDRGECDRAAQTDTDLWRRAINPSTMEAAMTPSQRALY